MEESCNLKRYSARFFLYQASILSPYPILSSTLSIGFRNAEIHVIVVIFAAFVARS